MSQNKENNILPIILTIIITALIVGGAVYWWQNPKTTSTTEVINDTSDIQTNTEIPNDNSNTTDSTDSEMEIVTEKELADTPTNLIDTAISGTSIEQSYNFRHGEAEGFTSISKGNIISMDKKAMGNLYINSEDITSFYAPEHPTNSDIIFISTIGSITGGWPNMTGTNKIYSYNIKNSEITQLYEEQENRLLRTIGMDGSKLILMYDIIDNSPGPCFSIWKDWKEFGYLELADIASGLQPYTIPEYQIEIGKIEQEKCIEEMGL